MGVTWSVLSVSAFPRGLGEPFLREREGGEEERRGEEAAGGSDGGKVRCWWTERETEGGLWFPG